ncbi:MAG: hypothetical protein MJ252_31115 [archaeon]|nr:hypothetical protein [archaeon]
MSHPPSVIDFQAKNCHSNSMNISQTSQNIPEPVLQRLNALDLQNVSSPAFPMVTSNDSPNCLFFNLNFPMNYMSGSLLNSDHFKCEKIFSNEDSSFEFSNDFRRSPENTFTFKDLKEDTPKKEETKFHNEISDYELKIKRLPEYVDDSGQKHFIDDFMHVQFNKNSYFDKLMGLFRQSRNNTLTMGRNIPKLNSFHEYFMKGQKLLRSKRFQCLMCKRDFKSKEMTKSEKYADKICRKCYSYMKHKFIKKTNRKRSHKKAN